MADNTDNDSSETTNEPSVRIAVQTAFGTREVDPADLPAVVRDMLVASLREQGITDEARTALAKALGIDLAASDDQVNAQAAQSPGGSELPDDVPQGVHGAGCDCAEVHQDHVWNILDNAFSNTPHLWQAMNELFKLSDLNPREGTHEERRDALESAQAHIQRQTALETPPLSPVEQLVADFRVEMGG